MEALCNEKHKRIDEKLGVHDTRLNNHSGRIDILENKESAHTVEINNLCTQIADLVKTIKWFIGLIIGSLGGFFIWYIQNN